MAIKKQHISSFIGRPSRVYNEIEQEFSGQYYGLIKSNKIVVACLALIAIIFGCIIRYPDMVVAELTIVNKDKPVPIIPKTNSKLIALLKTNGQTVSKGELVGLLESIGDYKEVVLVDSLLRGLVGPISNINSTSEELKFPHFSHLGELQNSFEDFYMNFQLLKSELDDHTFENTIHTITKEIEGIEELNTSLEAQRLNFRRDMELSRMELEAYQKLYDEKAVSDFDLNAYESKYIQKKNVVNQLELSLISNRNGIQSKRRELINFRSSLVQKRLSLSHLVSNLSADIVSWRNMYTLTSTLGGTIQLSKDLNEGDLLTRERPVMYVQQSKDEYEGQMYFDQENFGKIAVNQLVHVKLKGYPHYEFGELIGHITSISQIVNEEEKKFAAVIALPRNNVSTLGKQIALKNGMQANVEVIIDGSTLFERIVQEYRKRLTRNG